MLCVTALPAYSLSSPMPKMALWRVVTTVIGITVELAVIVLVFPVTARWVGPSESGYMVSCCKCWCL